MIKLNCDFLIFLFGLIDMPFKEADQLTKWHSGHNAISKNMIQCCRKHHTKQCAIICVSIKDELYA